MMREPGRWPRCPRLPLKRWQRQGEAPDFAVLVASTPFQFYEGALLPADDLAWRTPRLVDDPATLYDEGWRVD